MKLTRCSLNLFSKRKTASTLFSQALAEAAKEMSEEMGYPVKEQDKIKRFTGLFPGPSPLESLDGQTRQDS